MLKPDEPLEHGGRLLAAGQRFPDAPLPFLDLSTGINPMPYPVGPLPDSAWTRLPEPEALASLQRAAALAYGVADPAMVVAAPGTQLLISLLPHLLRHRTARILAPTYGEHRAAWANAGADAIETAKFDDLATTDAAILCNPNNPDGSRIPPSRLLELATTLAGRGGTLIVDEAFADLEPGPFCGPLLPHPGLVILRSFGKTYGLAGLRLGFALAAPPLAGRLRTALGPWIVSGPALAVAERALADAAWRRTASARLAKDGARLDALLTGAGMTVIGGTLLFRLASSPAAPGLFDRLGHAGILVRRFATHPTWLRFGLPGDHAAWERLETALRA